MVLNCNEIKKLISELPLTGSVIQEIREHDFKSFTLSLFHKEEKAWYLYVEVKSSDSHLYRCDKYIKPKASKLQRFGQYFRANIIGAKIVDTTVIEGERFFILSLSKKGEITKIAFRFYSGPNANILITDENNIIKEAFMRRPRRNDSFNNTLTIPAPNEKSAMEFKIRPYSENSFNEALYNYYRNLKTTDDLEDKTKRAKELRDKKINTYLVSIKKTEQRIQDTANYEELKQSGDVLASFVHMIKPNSNSVRLENFSGEFVTFPLNEKLTPSQNIEDYYQKAKKNKKANTLLKEELKQTRKELEETIKKFDLALSAESNEEKLKLLNQLLKEKNDEKEKEENTVGLRFISNDFEIIVGRNARENDHILRNLTRGSDLWLHTRDYPGGYVIIKSKKNKTVPLEVLLDAGNLALYFSKAKDNGKAELYYTMCKYLRRVKDGKQGLVIPTQEKNLTITLDEKRLKRLL